MSNFIFALMMLVLATIAGACIGEIVAKNYPKSLFYKLWRKYVIYED